MNTCKCTVRGRDGLTHDFREAGGMGSAAPPQGAEVGGLFSTARHMSPRCRAVWSPPITCRHHSVVLKKQFLTAPCRALARLHR